VTATGVPISLDDATELVRTGDLWLFRGSSVADQAIRAVTNSPVNHVGMAVVLDDLPPLMWHAELGRGLVDVWTGTFHRGVQLHDLRAAVELWSLRYDQRLAPSARPDRHRGDGGGARGDDILRRGGRRDVPGHGLLGSDRPTNYYDPGSFWSGDELELRPGARLGDELRVVV